MIIEAQNLGRRFKNEWIFRNLDFTFEQGNAYAVTGPNGSGKSTLMKTLCGIMPVTEGVVNYHAENPILPEDIYRHLVISAPYMELVEEYTLAELLTFHFQFKPMVSNTSLKEIMEFSHLKNSANKRIKNFSSGMKQRLKLALCFFSDVPIVLLDEPTTNLDEKGVTWYNEHFKSLMSGRLIIICSNMEREFQHCTHKLDMQDFK